MKAFSGFRPIRSPIKTPNFTQIRHKLKKNPQWYQYRRPSEPHELAKEFFDGLYAKRFHKDWPSIRCAMLSRKKYSAIINNHVQSDIEDEFIENGAIDIVKKLRENAAEMCEFVETDIAKVQHEISTKSQEESENSEYTEDTIFERFQWLEDQLEIYKNLSQTCKELKVFSYPKRDLSEFQNPVEQKRTNRILSYFLLDGSSILPILALDPKPDDHILDTCASPGGKLMCMMQISKDGRGTIIANDVSSSRSARIRSVQDEYIPKQSSIRKRMKSMTKDATKWEEIETGVYDKVLADVPCTTDRHSMIPTLDQKDNIFCILRKRERANLPQLQSDILRNAILACRPGGTIVYSTCTASMQQNEYVVQMTIQQLLHKHGVSCEIESLTPLSNLLTDHFYFFKNTELGILTLPFPDANYGPTYICKMIRTR